MTKTISKTHTLSNTTEFSVSELANAIKYTLEDGFSYVALRGEISGYRGPHASGHCYFAIKDDRSKIDAVMWRGVFAKLKNRPEEGIEVIAKGRVTTYPNSSKYQIIIDTLEPAGLGALMVLLEKRKKKFASEGLFDDDRKQALPFLPRVIGIITSPTGAVIRDMMHGFDERCPTHVILWPVHVQGEDSAAQVTSAINGFNQIDGTDNLPRPDILIVARGGGSLEDLWSFNEENVVRAAANSKIPLISAVGHETDWTLIDLVADARAPTPTKAAEWAVPKFREILVQTEDFTMRLKSGIRRSLHTARVNLLSAIRGLSRPHDLIALPRQRYDNVEQRFTQGLINTVHAHRLNIFRVSAKLNTSTLVVSIQNRKNSLIIFKHRTIETFRRQISTYHTKLVSISSRMNSELMRSRIKRNHEYLGMLTKNLYRTIHHHMTSRRATVEQNSKLLISCSYQSTLSRGFTVVRDRNGQTIKSKQDVVNDLLLEIEFRDGRSLALGLNRFEKGEKNFKSTILKKKNCQGTEIDTGKNNRKIRNDQGSLF
ncbi:MAG: Exodeoxyribonuclease 7 large subunit [Hyphomicrobiaceae bacterium hypho_1]